MAFACEIVESHFVFKFKKPSSQASEAELSKLFLDEWFEVEYEDESGTPYKVMLTINFKSDRYEGKPQELRKIN